MSGDTVENISLPTTPTNLDGCQDGNDVLVRSDTGRFASVTVQGGTKLKSYQKNGIFCMDAGTTCKVDDTTITGVGPDPFQAGNGFSAVDASSHHGHWKRHLRRLLRWSGRPGKPVRSHVFR